MASTVTWTALPTESLWRAVASGERYADWVVGTRAIRAVDEHWPAVGARLHFSVGYGPLSLNQTTLVRAANPGCWIELEAAGWPLGTVQIVLRFAAAGEGTRVALDEVPVHGPSNWVHNALADHVVKQRNVESLRRLCRLAAELSAA